MGDSQLRRLQIEPEDTEECFLAVGNVSENSYPLAQMLAERGISAEECTSGDQALSILKGRNFRGVLCDHTVPGMGAMGFLAEVRANFPDVAFVMVEEPGDVRQGVLAMIAGASDYLVKPLRPDAVIESLRRALKRKRLERILAKYAAKQNEG